MAGEQRAAEIQAATEIGGQIIGGIGGGISNYYGQKAKRKELDALIKGLQGLQGDVGAQTQAGIAESQHAYSPYTQGMQGTYADLMNTIGSTDYASMMPEEQAQFDFNKEQAISDYKERNQADIDAEIQRALGGSLQGGAVGGSLFSGATGKDIARSTADITGKYNMQAEQYAQQEEQNKYKKLIDKWQNDLALAQAKVNASQANIQNKQGLFNTQSNMFSNQRNEQTNLQTSGNQTLNDLKAQEIAAQASRKGTTSGIGSFLQGFGIGL